MDTNNKSANVSFDSLLKIFTVPEGPDSTLTKIEEKLSGNLNKFLRDHIVTEEKPLVEIEKNFSNPTIPEAPEFVSDHTEHLLDKLVAHSVHTSAPSFIGHMTSALPYYLMPLSKIMIALNQNLVKIETSKAFTPLERQVLGMLHKLVYRSESNNDDFYSKWMHSANYSLGAFCSGGTIANITALWVARNNLLKADGVFKGIEHDGLFAALKHYNYDGLAILVSERGHYSLKKAADVLGIGRNSIVAVATDENNKINIEALKQTFKDLKRKNIKPMAVVGVAGTTETGNVDPLDEMAQVCAEENCHFHVDAAWGGATLMSSTYRRLLKGIEQADSVTIDAHKQLYIPMGSGMVLFKDPKAMSTIQHHAAYILRKGSKDLGSHSLEGSRSGMAMLVYASMHIISRPGYELLIDQSIAKAHLFADKIEAQQDFQLVTRPELCLLTYRFVPIEIQTLLERTVAILEKQEDKTLNEELSKLNSSLNELTVYIQKKQRERGFSFVSRTTLTPKSLRSETTIVFRVVLANPLTTNKILDKILVEQHALAAQNSVLLDRVSKQAEAIRNWITINGL